MLLVRASIARPALESKRGAHLDQTMALGQSGGILVTQDVARLFAGLVRSELTWHAETGGSGEWELGYGMPIAPMISDSRNPTLSQGALFPKLTVFGDVAT